MKLILIEPLLKGFGQHHLTYAVGIASAARKLDIDTQIIVDRNIDSDVYQHLIQHKIDVMPIFATNVATCIKARAVTWPLLACEYARALRHITLEKGTDSIVLTASGNIEYLSGAAILLLNSSKQTRLIMQMYQWATREHISKTPRTIRYYRHITENLVTKAMDSGKLVLAGQSDGIAAHLSQLFRRPIPALPFVIDWSGFLSWNVRKNARLQIGFLGVMRNEKGLSQFVSAMEQNKSDVEFLVQALVPDALPEPRTSDLIDRLRKIPNCKLFEGELSIDEYRALLSRVDIVVLPYRPEAFRYKTSNIFAEAVGLAKVIITPKDTFMGKTAEDLKIGITYSPYISAALSEAMKEAALRFEELHTRSQEVAPGWRQENSAVEFLRRVIEIACFPGGSVT